MWSDVAGLFFVTAPILGALTWRNLRDHREEAAHAVRAQIHAGATRALGGESLLAIAVEGPTPWSHGQVTLTAPTGYESLIQDVAPSVFARMPANYDLLISCGGAS
jgi:hypothetical protein